MSALRLLIISVVLVVCISFLRATAPAAEWEDISSYVKQYGGTWDVQLIASATEIRQLTFHGTMTANVIGERWVITNLVADGAGHFFGHGVLGFDGKKWIAVWVDDTEPHMFIDQGQRTQKGLSLESRNPDLKHREGSSTLPVVDLRTDEWDGQDKYVSHFFKKEGNGAPREFMTISFRRVSTTPQRVSGAGPR